MKILSLITSDKINIDDKTGKATIEGVFNSINSSSFPAAHKEFFVSVITHGDPGKHHYKVSIIKDNKEISSFNEDISTAEHHIFIARFNDIVFPEQGKYTIRAVVDDEELEKNINLTIVK